MKFHDLVLLRDSHTGRYDEVAVFARNLDPKDVAACVGAGYAIQQEADRTAVSFAYGNVCRRLRIEEKLGIVVLSDGDDPKGPSVVDPNAYLLLGPLQRAASVSEDSAVPTDILRTDFALLRRQEGDLHRNLVMLWDRSASRGEGNLSGGRWTVLDSNIANTLLGPFFKWVKNRLWSDVPELPTLSHPFPGADAHPDKRGGELCVEGAQVPVARILAELTGRGVDAEPTCGGISKNLDLDYDTVRKCLRGLADWLKTQRWCTLATSAKCPKCGSANYGPDGTAMADACWDCGHVKPDEVVIAQPELLAEIAKVEQKTGRQVLSSAQRAETAATEKRCGTCREGWIDPTTGSVRNWDRLPCNHYADSPSRPDGPPWDNCRFWKGR
jgi:uncharacterized protein (DUF433 family)